MAPPCGIMRYGVCGYRSAVSANDLHFRHSHLERFTVSELLGIHCPAQGHFDWMDNCGTDWSYKFRVMLWCSKMLSFGGGGLVQSLIIKLFHFISLWGSYSCAISLKEVSAQSETCVTSPSLYSRGSVSCSRTTWQGWTHRSQRTLQLLQWWYELMSAIMLDPFLFPGGGEKLPSLQWVKEQHHHKFVFT